MFVYVSEVISGYVHNVDNLKSSLKGSKEFLIGDS